jgi:mannosyl-oligosaccharide alpha-1,2-mannosidase
MGFDELQPLSKHGVDGLSGLGATVVDALDITMIMGLNNIVKDVGSWIKKELPTRPNKKGHVATLNSYLCFSCI